VSGANDHVLATYHYPDGKYVNIESGWLYTKPFPFEMAVLISGSAGTVHWSSQWNRPPELYAGDGEPEVLEVGGGSGWGRTLDYFLDCVRDDQPVALCSPEDSRTTVALAHLECQAIASGEQIVVEPALR
jgi:predicted dehydrogenase